MQSNACLVRLTRVAFEMGCKWPYCYYLMGCCFEEFYKLHISLCFTLFEDVELQTDNNPEQQLSLAALCHQWVHKQ